MNDTITLTVNSNQLAAALICAAVKDRRYYLNGILIESSQDGSQAVIVATDGHRMLVQDIDGTGAPFAPVIIPRDLVAAVAAKARPGPVTITFPATRADDGAMRPVALCRGVVSVAGGELDARYPDWRRVVPSETSGQAVQFNVDYLADFGKVAALICPKKSALPHVHYNGESAALINFPDVDNAIGVLMPLRDRGAVMTRPGSLDWVPVSGA